MRKCDEDDELLQEMVRIARTNMETRFPLLKEHICATILTPSMKNLDIVDEWLVKNDTTKEKLLEEMISKHVNDLNEVHDFIAS